jgi:hypothetical protein
MPKKSFLRYTKDMFWLDRDNQLPPSPLLVTAMNVVREADAIRIDAIDPASGDIFIYISRSVSGRIAGEQLRKAVHDHHGIARRPLINLTEQDWDLPRYGRVPGPYFEIVGWEV